MIAWTLYESYCRVAALSSVQLMSPGYGVPSGSIAFESISGVNRSSIPLPDGPLNDSYTGCLSDHAVRSPAALATSKIVLTFR